MSKGTSAGLLDTPKAQSVFKHGILKNYVYPFAVMTASVMAGRRAVFVDGFAGRGRFDTGEAASAEQLMIEAQKARGARTNVDVFLVEQNPDFVERLEEVADPYRQNGLRVEIRQGVVEDYLDEIGRFARGATLFLFLDPCGANVPFDSLVSFVKRYRDMSHPRTELLLNISADLIRRYAGNRYKNPTTADNQLLDTMCGGEWWQDLAIAEFEASDKKGWTRAAQAVLTEYASRLADALPGRRFWAEVDVRREEHHEPVYWLLFMTQDPHGAWVMNDALAKARYDWLGHLAEQAAATDGQVPIDMKDAEQAGFKDYTRARLDAILASKQEFRPLNELADLLGDHYGLLWEKSIHQVLAEYVKAGRMKIIANDKKGVRRTFRRI